MEPLKKTIGIRMAAINNTGEGNVVKKKKKRAFRADPKTQRLLAGKHTEQDFRDLAKGSVLMKKAKL